MKILYLFVVGYVVIRIITALITHYHISLLFDIAWNVNESLLNNLGFIIVIIFGIANGLFLNQKANKNSNIVITAVSIIGGILLTIIALVGIWAVSFTLA